MSCGGVVVQRWIDGREPATEQDWRLVADELQRLHRVCAGRPQRPGCVEVRRLTRRGASVDADLAVVPDDVAAELLAVFAEFADAPASVVHGDPAASNIRMTDDGRVGLLDWDESRVDILLHDLSNLGVQVLNDPDRLHAQRLSHAWEAVNAWTVEPAYALQRLQNLRAIDDSDTTEHPHGTREQ
jgi:Ser/Thr protein kinase RdoA (MazF antagonist)